MNKKNINKIVLVSLCDSFSNELANAMSQTLDMVFCDTNALVEYELVDKKAMEELCTVAYLNKREKQVIKHIASFDNVIVSIPYDYLIRNVEVLRASSAIVFVELSKAFVKEKGSALNLLSYDDRTSNLKELADVSVSIRKTDIEFAQKKVLDSLGRFL